MTVKSNSAGESRLSSSPLEGEPKRPSRFGGGYNKRNTAHARNMRKEMTPWELQLWQRLRSKQLSGYKFRRQQPIGGYIVDFVNVEKKLIIELDGSQHIDSYNDKMRDAYLDHAGYRVLRFWNNEVNANIEGVLARILEMLEKPPHQTSFKAEALNEVWLPLKGGATVPASRAHSSISLGSSTNTVEEV